MLLWIPKLGALGTRQKYTLAETSWTHTLFFSHTFLEQVHLSAVESEKKPMNPEETHTCSLVTLAVQTVTVQ